MKRIVLLFVVLMMLGVLKTQAQLETITNPITGKKIQVAQNDFLNPMTWKQAKNACAELGNGWRLPTEDELLVMYSMLHKKGKGNFKGETYWSNYESSPGYRSTKRFEDSNALNKKETEVYYVRAVRTL